MKPILFILSAVCCIGAVSAQLAPGVYTGVEETNGTSRTHQLKVSDHYMIYTVYETSPAAFVKTLGGPVSITDGTLSSDLEFNSNYKEDEKKSWTSPYTSSGSELRLEVLGDIPLKKKEVSEQDLDGAWLFATRGPDEGQERRGEAQERKTLKFLMDGTFQWIAYHTGTMDFRGTGGGSYSAEDGVYTEDIEFFSRDSSRVGAELQFTYDVDGDDWHHKGKNSRGEPMYEIWSLRDNTH